MIRAAALALMLSAAAGAAQEAPSGLAEAPGAYLRGLDKVAGAASDITLGVGQTVSYGRVDVTLKACRYPADDPASNAYAQVRITSPESGETYFDGWMIAGSPALSALDHPRYDVWVMRCKTE